MHESNRIKHKAIKHQLIKYTNILKVYCKKLIDRGRQFAFVEHFVNMEGRREEVTIMILGDHSLCFEHLVRAYYNIKTGQDTKFILQECETRGVTTVVSKVKVDVNIRVATTRTASTRSPMDKIRINDYERRMSDVDVIILCFYQNNSKTLYNVRTKYLDEIKKYFPKTPYFLLGLNIDEMSGTEKKPLRETISIQDKFLKRDLTVPVRDSKRLAKKIKAQRFLQCSILHKLESVGPNSVMFDYDLEKCKNVKEVIDQTVGFAVKRKHRTCIIPFKR